MKIQVINPNSNKTISADIQDAMKEYNLPTKDVIYTTASDGPDTIESAFDECISAAAVIEIIKNSYSNEFKAHIIACFGDPGLDAARELTDVPVIGTAEAAMHMATLVASKFTIITTVARMKTHTENLLYKYGFDRKCSKVRAINCPVLSLVDDSFNTKSILEEECRMAIENDNVGALILGCAGMANAARDLSLKYGVPVIDGVISAIRLAEVLMKCKISTSKYGDYDFPSPKIYRGKYKDWSNYEYKS